ncbi:hypothetical protein BDR03DRAFT_972503 [Suillus americanus]|nr:hypothetical protein BDR03DRAFT_972503 [Suillus americanus]
MSGIYKLASPRIQSFGLDSDFLEEFSQTPADQKLGQICADLDTSADLSNRESGLEDCHFIASLGEAVRSRDTKPTS